MTKEQEIKKGNIKLTVFDEFDYKEYKKICDAITELDYTATIVNNGNVSFQKIVEEDEPYEEPIITPEQIKENIHNNLIKTSEEIIASLHIRIDNLDEVIHILEATANCHFSPDDKLWNDLLGSRDKLTESIEKDNEKTYKKIKELELKIQKIKLTQIEDYEKANVFFKHLESHKEVQDALTSPGIPICKICNKDANEIFEESKESKK